MDNDWGGAAIGTSVRLPGIDGSTSVLITGGTGAIGYRTAESFLGLGAKVAIMSRSLSAVDGAVARLAPIGPVIGIAGDVSVEEDAERAVAMTLAAFGRLDVLVHCAAVGGNAPLESVTAERIEKMLAVNIGGTLLMAKAAAVPMRAEGRGRIVTVSSIMGHRATSISSLYGTTKAAVAHATRALAVELGPSGITVNCISPASTPTAVRDITEEPGTVQSPPRGDAGSGGRIPLGRRGELDDYVGPILFYSSDLANYVTGADVLVDGGLALLRA